MAIWTYENTASLIENATMQIGKADGVPTIYRITPNINYVLHDNARDWEAYDEETGDLIFDENGNTIIVQGFTRGTATCSINYDFYTNPREFFTRLESEVPVDQIFGVGNNHEVM